MRNIPVHLELIVIGTLVVLAVILSIYAHSFPYFLGDLRLTLLFQSIHNDKLLLIMKGISYVFASWRSALLVIIACVIIWWCVGRLKAMLVIAAGLISLLNSLFKIAVDRPRPTSGLVIVYVAENGKSFPSGHAFFAMIFLGLLAYFAFTHLRNRGLRILISSSIMTLILLIGASRVYLGAHWTSDVLGGYLFGVIFLIVLIWLDRVFTLRSRWRQQQSLK